MGKKRVIVVSKARGKAKVPLSPTLKVTKVVPTAAQPAGKFASGIAAIRSAIGQLKRGKKPDVPAAEHHEQILEQRNPVAQVITRAQERPKAHANTYIWTKVPGFDALMEKGIPEGNATIIAGGAGSGKTIFCLQVLYAAAKAGKKCLYMSFEESAEKLMQHMRDFDWDPDPLIRDGLLIIQRFNPFDVTRGVDALLLRAKGELLIDIKPVLLPIDFKPDRVVVDSLTAIASAFTGKEDSYRIYIEQLFRFFEELGASSFLITETKQIPTVFSTTGVEEFLADGVVVLYNIKRGNIRENAIEILKLRGARHQKKIVAMQITDRGIEVFPEQEVFGDADAKEER